MHFRVIPRTLVYGGGCLHPGEDSSGPGVFYWLNIPFKQMKLNFSRYYDPVAVRVNFLLLLSGLVGLRVFQLAVNLSEIFE